MKKMSTYRKLLILLGVSLAGGLIFEYFVGLPQYVEGKLVTRKTEWMSPWVQKSIYYAYSDEMGQEVKHGPVRLFQKWCGGIYQACYAYGSYLDGMKENTWLSMDGNGEKTHENFYLNDRVVGQAVYHDGELLAYGRALYQYGYPIGSVTYECNPHPTPENKGSWLYRLSCNGQHTINRLGKPDSRYEKCKLAP